MSQPSTASPFHHGEREVQTRLGDPTNVVSFDRKSVIGLHHLALAVDGDASLDALYDRLKDDSRVDVEFSPEPLLGGPTRHMMCNIPGGGIRIEFVAA